MSTENFKRTQNYYYYLHVGAKQWLFSSRIYGREITKHFF